MQFIKLPDFKEYKNLNYKDILVYSVIASFDNPNSKIFPSLRLLASKSSLSLEFVGISVKRLEIANLIHIDKGSRHINFKYTLLQNEVFTMIPVDFLELPLEAEEKAILLHVRLLCTDTFETFESLTSIAKKSNISQRTFMRYVATLKEAGYITSRPGVNSKLNILKLERFDWGFTDSSLENEKYVPGKPLIVG